MLSRAEDSITGYRPSRVAVLEDEEREAQETSSSYAEPPIFQWSKEVDAVVRAHGGKLRLRLLVLVNSLEACCLLQNCTLVGQCKGSMKAAGSGEGTAAVCQLHLLGDGDLEKGEGVLFALCRGPLPPSRAFAWGRELLSRLQPEEVVVEEAISAAEFSGGGGDREEPSQSYSVTTSAAAATKMRGSLQKLPTGNLVSGLPAAVMSRAQASGLAAVLLVTVKQGHSPGRSDLESLGAALQACLATSGSASTLEGLYESTDLQAATKDLSRAWQKQARASMYV